MPLASNHNVQIMATPQENRVRIRLSVATRDLWERRLILAGAGSTPSLFSRSVTVSKGNPQREQKRISSEVCAWLHFGQNIAGSTNDAGHWKVQCPICFSLSCREMQAPKDNEGTIAGSGK